MPTRTWRGTTNSNWGTSTNWLEGAIPTAADDVVFDATSPACTVNVSGVCLSIDFTNYTNTITMTNGITVGNLISSVVFIRLGASMSISGSGGLSVRKTSTFTLTCNGKIWPNAFNLFTVGSTLATSVATLADNALIGGTLSIGDASGNYTINGAFEIRCYGSFSTNILTNNSVQITSGAIRFLGNGTWSQSFASVINGNIFIDCGVNTLSISNSCACAQNLVYVSGTVSHSGTFYIRVGGSTQTININGSSSTSATTTSTTGVNFSSLVIYSTTTAPAVTTLSSPICVVSSFTYGSTIHNNGLVGRSSIDGSFIYLNGDLTVRGRLLGSAVTPTTILLQGTGTWSDTSAGTSFNTGISTNLTINTAGTITVSGLVSKSRYDFTYVAGTVITTGSTLMFEDNNQTVNISGATWNNLTFLHSGNPNGNITLTFTGNTTFLGNCLVNKTGAALTLNGGKLIIGGNFSAPVLNTAGQINGTTVLEFNGAGSFYINPASYTPGTTTGTGIRNNIIFNNGSNTFTLNSFRFSPGSTGFTYTSGNIDATACTLDVLQLGTMTMNTNGMTWNTINIRASGNLTTTLNSKLTLSGTLNLNAIGGVYTFGGNGGFEVANFETQLPDAVGRIIYFSQTAPEFKINTSLTMVGTAAIPRPVQNQSGLTRAVFTLDSSATQNVYYVNATRMDSGAGQTIWSFGATLSDTINWNVGGPVRTSAITYVN